MERMADNSRLTRATEAIVEAHDEEMRAFLRGDVPANQWRPEKYAEAVLAALGLDRLCWNCHGRVPSCGSCYGWSLSCSCPRDKQGDRRGHHVESCGYSKPALTATRGGEGGGD